MFGIRRLRPKRYGVCIGPARCWHRLRLLPLVCGRYCTVVHGLTQQPITLGTQGVPRVDRNKAIRWLNTVRTQLPDIKLRGIVDGLNGKIDYFLPGGAYHPHDEPQMSWFLNASGTSDE